MKRRDNPWDRRGGRDARRGAARRDPRARLLRPAVPGDVGEPVSVGDAAALVSEELGLAEPRSFARLLDAWPEIVGDALARHARVRGVRAGVLEVAVDSPAWATQLRYLEADLVARASRVVGPGVVETVRVVVEQPPPPAP